MAPVTASRVDRARLAAAVRELLAAIGEDPSRPGLRETPERVAELYADLFSGVSTDPVEELADGLEEGHSELVILRHIPFYSMCEHHLLPFQGVAHVAYLPNNRIVGFGKLARVVQTCARRPQLQERFTTQIADTLDEGLRPRGIVVVVEATHLCLAMRGVKLSGVGVVTIAARGLYAASAAARAEVLALLPHGQISGNGEELTPGIDRAIP